MEKKSGKSLTKLTSLNAVSSLVNYAATILVSFIVSPILLTLLGTSLFGSWKICQRLLVFISAADGRATQALRWTIANKQSSDDLDAKRRDVGSALIVWLRFLPLILASGSILAWVSPYFIRGLPPEHFNLIRLTCAILVVNMIVSPLHTVPEGVMVGMNLGYRCTWINAFGTILGGILMVVAAYCGWGLIGLATAFLSASLFQGGAILFAAKRSLSWFGIALPQGQELKKFFGFSIWVLLWTFINKVMLSSDIVILGVVASAEKVTTFVLSYYLLQMAIDFSALVVSSAIPGLGGIVGEKDFERANKIRDEIMEFSWLFVTVLGSMILLWNFTFIKLWVGQENFIGFVENFLVVLLMTQLVFIRNDAFIVDVTLKIKSKVIIGAVSTVLSISFAYLLSKYIITGISGLVIGLISGRMVLSFVFPILVKRAFNKKIKKIDKSSVRRFAVMTIFYPICAYLGSILIVEKWIGLIVYSGLSLVVVAAFVFFFGFNCSNRSKIVTRMCNVFPSRIFPKKINSVGENG